MTGEITPGRQAFIDEAREAIAAVEMGGTGYLRVLDGLVKVDGSNVSALRGHVLSLEGPPDVANPPIGDTGEVL